MFDDEMFTLPEIDGLFKLLAEIEEKMAREQAEEENRYKNIAIDEDLEESLWS